MPQLINLTGDAIQGIAPSSVQALFAPPPITTVALGRNEPVGRPQAIRLEDFVDTLTAAPPASVDWFTKAARSISRMYLNDRYGICVFSSRAHALGIWSANDSDSGEIVLAEDQELYSQYQAVCGRGDNGCYMPTVNNYMKDTGILAGGKRYKIEGYVSCDWRSKELTQVGITLFGAGVIGFNFPNSWSNSAVWDLGPTNFVGGHEVCTAGYGPSAVISTTKDGVIVSSWGRLYLFTWAAWTSTRYISEFYFMLPVGVWTGLDGRNPGGVDLAKLRQYLAMIGNGDVPPLDPPPVPPPGPGPGGGFTGTDTRLDASFRAWVETWVDGRKMSQSPGPVDPTTI